MARIAPDRIPLDRVLAVYADAVLITRFASLLGGLRRAVPDVRHHR